MRLKQLRSGNGAVVFAYGEDGHVLAADADEFSTVLPSTQDYYITVFGERAGNRNFHYRLEMQ